MLIAYKKACIMIQLLRWMYTITYLEVVRYSISIALDFESITNDTDKIFKRCSLCAFLSLHWLIIAENTIWSVENLIDSEADFLRWDHEKFHIWQCYCFTKICSPCVCFHWFLAWLLNNLLQFVKTLLFFLLQKYAAGASGFQGK